jgi:hypothetical protein
VIPPATATQTLPVRPGCEDTYDVPFFWFLISAHLGLSKASPMPREWNSASSIPAASRWGFQIGQAPDGTPAPDGRHMALGSVRDAAHPTGDTLDRDPGRPR